MYDHFGQTTHGVNVNILGSTVFQLHLLGSEVAGCIQPSQMGNLLSPTPSFEISVNLVAEVSAMDAVCGPSFYHLHFVPSFLYGGIRWSRFKGSPREHPQLS